MTTSQFLFSGIFWAPGFSVGFSSLCFLWFNTSLPHIARQQFYTIPKSWIATFAGSVVPNLRFFAITAVVVFVRTREQRYTPLRWALNRSLPSTHRVGPIPYHWRFCWRLPLLDQRSLCVALLVLVSDATRGLFLFCNACPGNKL